MNKIRDLILVAALPALSATPALAHGGHSAVSTAAHGPLHMLMGLGGVVAAAAMVYLAARAVKARHRST